MDEVCTCVYQVRAQLAGEAAGGKKVSVVEIGKTILRNEGPKGLYAGLSAAAARQLSYGNLRLVRMHALLLCVPVLNHLNLKVARLNAASVGQHQGIYSTLRDQLFEGKDPSGTAKLGAPSIRAPKYIRALSIQVPPSICAQTHTHTHTHTHTDRLYGVGMGCVAGGIAAFLSNPIEVTLVRMQAGAQAKPNP
jgi:hypothetical protein